MTTHLSSLGVRVWRSVRNGYEAPTIKDTTTKQMRAKEDTEWNSADNDSFEANSKALGAIYGALSETEFSRISACTTAKETWDILCVTHEGKLQTFELNHLSKKPSLKPNKSIAFKSSREESTMTQESDDDLDEEEIAFFAKKFKCANTLKKKVAKGYKATWDDDSDRGSETPRYSVLVANIKSPTSTKSVELSTTLSDDSTYDSADEDCEKSDDDIDSIQEAYNQLFKEGVKLKKKRRIS
ncbi:hypothetical protein RHMOL_Rhmol11G0002200 [Rhododendron molle]|uniref:Uncharacterized protein n=1 Tax=Rhododendron molle TaxID=49168 RepID=A0ACC0LME3_RHOML|nr:hypothetical protein RHMOL_Rhmol11G0002200 [Rhododendron molle]